MGQRHLRHYHLHTSFHLMCLYGSTSFKTWQVETRVPLVLFRDQLHLRNLYAKTSFHLICLWGPTPSLHPFLSSPSSPPSPLASPSPPQFLKIVCWQKCWRGGRGGRGAIRVGTGCCVHFVLCVWHVYMFVCFLKVLCGCALLPLQGQLWHFFEIAVSLVQGHL